MAHEIAPATATISVGGLPSRPSEAHAAIESIMGELDSLPDKPKSPDKPTPSPTNIVQTSPKEEVGKDYKSLFEGLNGGENYQQVLWLSFLQPCVYPSCIFFIHRFRYCGQDYYFGIPHVG